MIVRQSVNANDKRAQQTFLSSDCAEDETIITFIGDQSDVSQKSAQKYKPACEPRRILGQALVPSTAIAAAAFFSDAAF
jgi:hypothetical protein